MRNKMPYRAGLSFQKQAAFFALASEDFMNTKTQQAVTTAAPWSTTPPDQFRGSDRDDGHSGHR